MTNLKPNQFFILVSDCLMYLSPFAYKSLHQCVLLPKPANYYTIWGLQSVVTTKPLCISAANLSVFVSTMTEVQWRQLSISLIKLVIAAEGLQLSEF